MNAAFKIVTLELAKTEKVLFILAGDKLYLIADIAILQDAKPGKPKPTPGDDDEDPIDDGQTYNIICCGQTFNCAEGDNDCTCAKLAPDCDGKKNKLFFEILSSF